MAIPAPSSISLFAAPTTDIPWIKQAPSGDEYDFAPNASLIPSRTPYVVLTPPERLTESFNLNDNISSTETETTNELKPMTVDGGTTGRTPGATRRNQSVPVQRVFHDDRLSPTPNLLLHKVHGLPQPTSPMRSKFRRRSWFTLAVAGCQHLFAHPTTYLALYFTLNLGLTLYNKSLLISFPFPYTLSALHALCGTIGSLILVRTGSTPVPRLNTRELLILLAFSGLYTINIIVSNVSLGLVTIPFHQVVRAATPLFTILFSTWIFGKRSSRKKLVALLPVVAGVGFATYGDYYFTPWGLILTLLGTVLASLKTIYTNFLQAPASYPRLPKPDLPEKHANTLSSLRRVTLPPLSPLHLLYLLSPLAFLETTVLAQLTGELDSVWEYFSPQPNNSNIFTRALPPTSSRVPESQLALLLFNGVMAFGLNVVSFSANRKVGALSMTVAANVKQVLTILCAVALFNLTITPMNAIGIVLTLVGGAVYASVELKEKLERSSSH